MKKAIIILCFTLSMCSPCPAFPAEESRLDAIEDRMDAVEFQPVTQKDTLNRELGHFYLEFKSDLKTAIKDVSALTTSIEVYGKELVYLRKDVNKNEKLSETNMGRIEQNAARTEINASGVSFNRSLIVALVSAILSIACKVGFDKRKKPESKIIKP